MNLFHFAAWFATGLLVVMMVFQALLALGRPYGHLAWGGTQPRVLPPKLRAASAASIVVLAFASWCILARVGAIEFASDVAWVQAATWVFVAFFALNTLTNLTSKSRAERTTMTPISALLLVCFAFVALS